MLHVIPLFYSHFSFPLNCSNITDLLKNNLLKKKIRYVHDIFTVFTPFSKIYECIVAKHKDLLSIYLFLGVGGSIDGEGGGDIEGQGPSGGGV